MEALGHEVVVADPMYATGSRCVKTERRDARGVGADAHSVHQRGAGGAAAGKIGATKRTGATNVVFATFTESPISDVRAEFSPAP